MTTKQAIVDLLSAFLGGALLSIVLPIEAWRCGLAGVGLLLVVQACTPRSFFR